MGETKKETKKFVSSNARQAISRRILVAEDNKSIQKMVYWILDFMGFEVALVSNGVEALSLFLANPFDLVLTGLEMPIMDGSKLAELVKERSPKTPVILLTATDRETVSKKVTKGSVDSIISKPFKLNDFQSTVQGVLAFREGGYGSAGVGWRG